MLNFGRFGGIFGAPLGSILGGMINPGSPKTIQISKTTSIGPNEKCFIIAEIGQNHQGDLNIAKQMVLAAKESGADCVKFQKSHLPSKFNKNALSRPYTGPNSWGDTYGSHKEYLEFSEENFITLQKFAHENDIIFSSSAMDETSLMFLNSINVPFIKIGSGDFHNKKLLERAASLEKPLIVSTGMSNESDVTLMYNLLKSHHLNFCLLHCVSSYPLPYEEVNLNVIPSYKNLYPDINIGYSGHELGVDVPLASVALGAKVIEKHFTLNKTWKGTDHICSLTPPEFKDMVDKIRKFEGGEISPEVIFMNEIVQKSLGCGDKKFQESETACFEKLGKTVVASRKLENGDVISWENICLKVAEPKGVLGRDAHMIVGKTVKRMIEIDESILNEDLCD